MTQEQLQELVENYCLDTMSEDDRALFEVRLEHDTTLQKLVNEHRAFLRLINHKSSKDFVLSQMNIIKNENKYNVQMMANTMQLHVNKYWKVAGVAAAIAFIASFITFKVTKNRYDELIITTNQNLNRVTDAVNNLNERTTAIDNKLKVKHEQPTGNSKKSATCFAITNNGYAVTNAHVVAGSGEIFIFTNDNIGHKASVVDINDSLDIAVVKITESDFTFSENKNLPYTFFKNNSNIAQEVYTLGFPKSSLVYNKGYISSETGRGNDSNRYQLELPSSPGVSGSPVFDNNGNIVAIINSKESESSSTTYALKSIAINNYLGKFDSIKTSNIANINGSRSSQINKLKPFICEIKVY